MGPGILIVKRGEHGVTVFAEDDIFMAPAFPIPKITDPTGAGDSFAGGLMGYLAHRDAFDSKVLRQATVMGSVLASFTVEDFSLDRFRPLERQEVNDRFTKFRALTEFDSDDATV